MLTRGLVNITSLEPPGGLVTKPGFQIIQQAEFAVDAFFMMSGFLGVHAIAFKMKQSALTRTGDVASGSDMKPTVPIGIGASMGAVALALLNRAVRLWPLMVLTLLFSGYLAPFLGAQSSFGLLPGVTMSAGIVNVPGSACLNWWWTNMLFVNNMVPYKDNFSHECLGWTWYLAVDMQLFLAVVLPVIVLLAVLPRDASTSAGVRTWVAYGYCIVLLAASQLAATLVVKRDNLTPFVFAPPVPPDVDGGISPTRGDESDLYYSKPWMRAPAYIIGVLLGIAYTTGQGHAFANAALGQAQDVARRAGLLTPRRLAALAMQSVGFGVIAWLYFIPVTVFPPILQMHGLSNGTAIASSRDARRSSMVNPLRADLHEASTRVTAAGWPVQYEAKDSRFAMPWEQSVMHQAVLASSMAANASARQSWDNADGVLVPVKAHDPGHAQVSGFEGAEAEWLHPHPSELHLGRPAPHVSNTTGAYVS